MKRWFPLVALAFLLVACSTSKPASEAATTIDVTQDPSAIGAVDEAVLEGSAQAAAAAETGRRIGRVAGVLAAVLGGPERESVDHMVDRYHRTRDAAETAGAVIGATKGAVDGAKRGFVLDLQFAELKQIEGLEVTRPYPDYILVYFANAPSRELLTKVAAVFAGREHRAIEIEGAGATAFDVRDSLIELGLPATNLVAYRDDGLRGVLLHITYR